RVGEGHPARGGATGPRRPRVVSDRHRAGILPVEKGPGVTSFQMVAHLRRVLRAPRVGHGGTLDPAATGLLPILVGEATKLTPYLVELDKEYVATVRLGVTTETQDLTGAVLETRPVPALEAPALEAALAPFVGTIQQVPPMFSALHRDGKRLYELARQGVEVEREPRQVVVHSIRLETAVTWDEVREARSGEALWARLLPPDSALVSLGAVRLDADGARAFTHGQTVASGERAGGLLRVYGPDGGLLGVGQGLGDRVKPERLLHADPPRPSIVPA